MKPFAISICLIITWGFSNAQLPGWDYMFSAQDIRQITEDGNYLWIATQTGLVKREKSTQQVTYYNTTNSGLIADQINTVIPDGSGGIWVGTFWDGLMHYDGTDWTLYNKYLNPEFPSSNIQDIYLDGAGHLWVGFWGNTQGICEFDGTSWTFHNITCECVDLEGDSNDNIWVTCWPFGGGGVQRYDGASWTSYTTATSSIPTDNVGKLAIDSNDDIWIGTNGVGAGLIKFDGSTWTQMHTGNSTIPSDDIIGVMVDNNDDVWIGTPWSGVARYDGSTWTTYGSLGNVSSLFKDAGGDVWAGIANPGGPGSYGGLHQWNGGDWDTLALGNAPLPGNRIQCMDAKFGTGQFDVWIGTESGIVYWDSTSWTSYTAQNSNLNSGNCKSIIIDGNDQVWAGTDFGLGFFDGAAWTNYTTIDGLPGNNITTLILDDQNKPWVGTLMNGLSYYNGSNFTNYTTIDGLPSDWVTALAVDSNHNLWVGTMDNGVGFYDGTNWTTYNTGNSDIPSDDISSIAMTVLGPIVGTNGGGVAIYRTDSAIWQYADIGNSDLLSDYILSVTVMDYVDGSGKRSGEGGQTAIIGTDNGPQRTKIVVGHHGNPLLTLAELLVGDSFYQEYVELQDRVNAASGVVDSLLGKRGAGTNYYMILGGNNGLMVNPSFNINFDPSFSVSGTVYLPGGATPATEGVIQIVESGGALLDTCHIRSDGTYACDIDNVPLCIGINYYIIAYYPDPYVYLPTVFGNVVDWEDGIYFEACDVQTGKDITLIPYPSGPTGPGNIMGIVTQGTWSGKSQGPGDPLNGIDMFLIDKSSNEAIQFDTTDQQGIFEFTDVPEGSYGLLASIPGIPVDTLFGITITAAGETVDDIEVTVDSTLIHFNRATSLPEPTVDRTGVQVFPNPFQGSFGVQYTLAERTSLELRVYDLMGKVILEQQEIAAEGEHQMKVDLAENMAARIYFLEVKIGEEVFRERLVGVR